MSDDGLIQIRSYRICFRLERRIHKIDRWRVPLPYGIPVVGVGWALAVLAFVLIASKLPLVGMAVQAVPAPIRLLIAPIAVAFLLTRWRIDGRPPYGAAVAFCRWRLAPQRLVAFRAASDSGPATLGVVTFAADGRDGRLRPGVVRGPARVVLRHPARLRERGRTLHVTPQAGPLRTRGTEVRLRPGQRVVVGQ